MRKSLFCCLCFALTMTSADVRGQEAAEATPAANATQHSIPQDASEPAPDDRVEIQLPDDKLLADAIRKLVAAIDAREVAELKHSRTAIKAILRIDRQTDYKKVRRIVETLKHLRVGVMAFSVSADAGNFVIIEAPSDVPWTTVRALTEELSKQQEFKYDVRVRKHDEPPTSTLNGGVASGDPVSPPPQQASHGYRGYTLVPAPRDFFGAAPPARDSLVSALPPGEDPRLFSFYMNRGKEPAIEALQKQHTRAENKANEVAAVLRSLLPQASIPQSHKDEVQGQLRTTVTRAFKARQNLQRAELAQFAARLQRIQKSIEARDELASKIVDRRVEELLDPNVQWKQSAVESKLPTAETASEASDQQVGAMPDKANDTRFPNQRGELAAAESLSGPVTANRVSPFDQVSNGASSTETSVPEAIPKDAVVHLAIPTGDPSLGAEHTGLIVSKDGFVVTKLPKFGVGGDAMIRLSNGQTLSARLVNADAKRRLCAFQFGDHDIRKRWPQGTPFCDLSMGVNFKDDREVFAVYRVEPQNGNGLLHGPFGTASFTNRRFDHLPALKGVVPMAQPTPGALLASSSGLHGMVVAISFAEGDGWVRYPYEAVSRQQLHDFVRESVSTSKAKDTTSVPNKPEESTVPKPPKDHQAKPRLPIDKEFSSAGENGALRVSFDDFDLKKHLNMDPVPVDAAEQFPDWLTELDKKRIRLRGFMYPTFTATGLTKFGLARDNDICCFARQPKIFEMVEVKMADNEATNFVADKPVDVEGVFRIDPHVEEGELYQLFRMTDATIVD